MRRFTKISLSTLNPVVSWFLTERVSIITESRMLLKRLISCQFFWIIHLWFYKCDLNGINCIKPKYWTLQNGIFFYLEREIKRAESIVNVINPYSKTIETVSLSSKLFNHASNFNFSNKDFPPLHCSVTVSDSLLKFVQIVQFVTVTSVQVTQFVPVVFLQVNLFAIVMFVQVNLFVLVMFVQVNLFALVMFVQVNLFVPVLLV